MTFALHGNPQISCPKLHYKFIMWGYQWNVTRDILGSLPITHKKNSYLLVIGDYFTKWIDAVPMKNKKATSISQKLLQHIIPIFGVPMKLLSDQGKMSESIIFQKLCKLLGIEKIEQYPTDPNLTG